MTSKAAFARRVTLPKAWRRFSGEPPVAFLRAAQNISFDISAVKNTR